MSASTVYDTLDNWQDAGEKDIDGWRFGVEHVEDGNVGVYVTHADPGFVVWVQESGERQRVDYTDDKTEAKGSMQQWAKKLSNVRAARSFVRETGVEEYGVEVPDTIADKDGESIPYSIGSRKVRRKLADYYESTDEIAEASDAELDSFAGLGPKTLEGLRDEFGGGDPDDEDEGRPFRLGDMVEVEPSGFELDDPATVVKGIGDANYYADKTLGDFWDQGCPFHEVSGQYQQTALRQILGADFYDRDNPDHVIRVFSGYMGADAYDEYGDQLGNYPEAMFGMFPWSDVSIAWSWGADAAGGNVGADASAGADIIEQQAALGSGEDLPFAMLDYDPEEDHGLSGLHDVVGIDSYERASGKTDVVYTADTSPLGEVDNDVVHVPHDTVWFYSLLFGADYTDLRVAQDYVKVVVDTTDNLPETLTYSQNRQWVAVFDHPDADFWGIAEGSLAVEPWDFDLDATDQFDEWAAEVAERIEQRNAEMRVPERVRRGVAPEGQLDDAVGISALTEDDYRPVDRAEPNADEEFEEQMASVYDPTTEYEAPEDADPTYAVVHEDGAYKYIRGFGGDEAAADAHAAEMGEQYEVQYDGGRSAEQADSADESDDSDEVTVTADGREYEVPQSGSGYTIAEVSDDPQDGVGHGPTFHVRYEEDDGRGLLAVKGRGTNARLFHWGDTGKGRSTRTTLHGPVGVTEVMRHLREHLTGERDLPHTSSAPLVEGRPEVGTFVSIDYDDGGGLMGTVTRIDDDANEALVRVSANSEPVRYDWNTNTVTEQNGDIEGVVGVELVEERPADWEDDGGPGASFSMPEQDNLQTAIASRGINNIVASNLADQYDSISEVEQAVREADDPSDIKGVGKATAQDVAAAFLGTDDTDTSVDTPFNPGNVDTVPDEVKTPDIDGGPPERVGDLWRTTDRDAEINYDHKGGEDIQVRLEATDGGYEVVHVEDDDRYVVDRFDSRGPAVDKTVSLAHSVLDSEPIREQDHGSYSGYDPEPSDLGYKNKRMENAHYWAAQLLGYMKNGPNAGIRGTYYVDVIGGKPVLVMNGEEWNESGVDAIKTGLREVDFPAPLRVKTDGDGNYRLWVSEPSDDRMTSRYYQDWQQFEPTGGDQGMPATKFAEDQMDWDAPKPESAMGFEYQAEQVSTPGSWELAEVTTEARPYARYSPVGGGAEIEVENTLGAYDVTDEDGRVLANNVDAEEAFDAAEFHIEKRANAGANDAQAAKAAETKSRLKDMGVNGMTVMHLVDDGDSVEDVRRMVEEAEQNGDITDLPGITEASADEVRQAFDMGRQVEVEQGIGLESMGGETAQTPRTEDSVERLTQVEGIGPKRAKALLTEFGGVREVYQKATSNWAALAEVDGISEDTARDLFDRMQAAGVTPGATDASTDEPTDSSVTVNKTDQPDYLGGIYDPTEEVEGSTNSGPELFPVTSTGRRQLFERRGWTDLTDSNGNPWKPYTPKKTVAYFQQDDFSDREVKVAYHRDATDSWWVTRTADGTYPGQEIGRTDDRDDAVNMAVEWIEGDATLSFGEAADITDDSDPYDPDEDTDRIGREQAEKERAAVRAAENTDPDQKLSGPALKALKKQWGRYKQTLSEGREAAEEVEEYREARAEGEEAAAIINDIRAAHGQEPIDFDGVDAIPSVEELAGPITKDDPGISLSFSWDAGIYDPTEDV